MSSPGDSTLQQPPVAEQLGPYRLVRRLGQGGMGVVHLGTGPDGQQVAIKVLRPHVAYDPTARARLEREAATLRLVDHPGVAGVIDHDLYGDRPYLVTRYIAGPALDDKVGERGPLTPRKLLLTAGCLAESLQAIHAVGVVHRDLKPGNVLLHEGRPVIIDFGIAQAADDLRLTATGLVIGTPGYLAPELIEGAPVTSSADWWGWAATVAFAATGRKPFGKGPFEVVLHRVQTGKADLEGVDPRLGPLLEATLSPNRADRPTPEEILAGLSRYSEGRDAFVRPDRNTTVQQALAGSGTLSSDGTAVIPATDPDATPPGGAAGGAAGGLAGSAAGGMAGPAAGGLAARSAAGGLAAAAVSQLAAGGTAVLPVDGTKLLPENERPVPPPAEPEITPEQVAALVPPLIPKRTPKPTPKPKQPQPVVVPQHQQQPAHQPAFAPYPAPGYPPPNGQPALGQHPLPNGQPPVHQPRQVPQQPQAQPQPRRPASTTRSGTIVALMLAAVALAARAPVFAAILVAVLIVIGRVVDRTSTALMRRRQTRGGRGRSDGWVAVVASPVHLAVAVLITLLCLILPVILAVTTGGAVAAGLATERGTDWPPLAGAAAATGAFFGLLAAWWGPGGSSLRRGTHTIVRAALQPTWLRTIVVLLLLAFTLLAGMAAASGTPTSWAPAGDPFDSRNLPDRPRLPDVPRIDIPFVGNSI